MRIAVTAFAVLSAAASAGAASVAVGDKLAPFSLENYDGKALDLASLEGNKAVVLVFISTQCPVSNAYNGRMAGLAKEYGAKGVAFVAINANRAEAPAEIAAHAGQNGFPFPVLKDLDNVQADRLRAQVTPEAYVYDSSWTLRYHGRIDDSQRGDAIKSQDLRAALDALLAGKDVSVKETKAFGCTIKRLRK